MATHSSILSWGIPWIEEPGRLQSMKSQRVGHDWVTHFHFSFQKLLGSLFEACRTLLPRPGIELVPPAVEMES